MNFAQLTKLFLIFGIVIIVKTSAAATNQTQCVYEYVCDKEPMAKRYSIIRLFKVNFFILQN